MFKTRPNTVDEGVFKNINENNSYKLPADMTGSICIDVGAHIGSFSYACLQRGAAKVYAYEADLDNYLLLRENMKQFGDRVEVCFAAVTRSDIHIPILHFNKCNNKRNTGGGHVRRGIGKPVAAIALDTILDSVDKCDVLKLDCEGSEFPILYTSKHLNKVTHIAGEYHAFREDEICETLYVKDKEFTIDCLAHFIKGMGFDVEHSGRDRLGLFFCNRTSGNRTEYTVNIDDSEQHYLRKYEEHTPVMRRARIPDSYKYTSNHLAVLQYCLDLTDIPEGLVLEFGVFSGNTINLISKKFKDRVVHGFDSFTGFHGEEYDGRTEWCTSKFDRKGVLPKVEDNVQLVKGFFEDTLDMFLDQHTQGIAFVHIDCDIYSGAAYVLQKISNRLLPDCIIVFDELLHYYGFHKHEWRALMEFKQNSGRTFTWLAFRDKIMDCDMYKELIQITPHMYGKDSSNTFTALCNKEFINKGYGQGGAIRIKDNPENCIKAESIPYIHNTAVNIVDTGSYIWTSPYNSCWPAQCYKRSGKAAAVDQAKIVAEPDMVKYILKHKQNVAPLLIMGNFVVDRYAIKNRALQAGMDVIHGEDGFFPHYTTLHVDPVGFCWESSIPQLHFKGVVAKEARELSTKLRADARKNIDKNPFDPAKKHVIFPLQLIQDKVNQFCLNIRSNWVEILKHARDSLPKEVVMHIKTHPRAGKGQQAELDWASATPNVEVYKGDLYTALAHCDGVIGVNSTVLTEARLLFDKPVWAYGDSWYTNHTALINRVDLRFRSRTLPYIEHLEKGIGKDDYLESYRDWYMGQLLSRQYTQKVESDPERYIQWLRKRTYKSYVQHGEEIFGFEGIVQ